MKKLIFTAAMLLLALSYSPILKAQESDVFCTSLKFLMESSKDSFMNVKGRLVTSEDRQKDDPKIYPSKRMLPDADSTYIIKDMKMSHVSIMGTDEFHSSGLVNQYYDLAEKIHTCLGTSYSYEETKDEMTQVMMYKIRKNTGAATDKQEPVIYLKLDDSNDEHRLLIEIEEPFFKKRGK